MRGIQRNSVKATEFSTANKIKPHIYLIHEHKTTISRNCYTTNIMWNTERLNNKKYVLHTITQKSKSVVYSDAIKILKIST